MFVNKLIKENIAPTNASKIGVFDENGTLVGTIKLGSLKNTLPNDVKLFSFGLLSDTHVTPKQANSIYPSYEPIDTFYGNAPEEDFESALRFCGKEGVKFVAMCGDLTGCNGSGDGTHVLDEFKIEINDSKLIIDKVNKTYNIPVFTCLGNHDLVPEYNNVVDHWFSENSINKISDNFTLIRDTNSTISANFYFEYKNLYFVFLSLRHHYSYAANYYYDRYSSLDIKWLKNTLDKAQNENKRAFVFMHLFFPDRAFFGVDYKHTNIMRGNDVTNLKAICDSHPNTVWFSGHTHTSLTLLGVKYVGTDNAAALKFAGEISQSFIDTEFEHNYSCNIWPANSNDNYKGPWCVHVPACTGCNFYDSGDKDPTTFSNVNSRHPNDSQFYIVDVYTDYIMLRGVQLVGLVLDKNGNITTLGELKFIPMALYKLNV